MLEIQSSSATRTAVIVGFGDATILSADPRSALDCVLYVEPMNHRDGNAIIGRSWGATPSGGWAIQALGDIVWSDGLLAFGRTAIMAQGNQFGAIVSGDDAVTANGRLAGVRASAPGDDGNGQAVGVGVASSGSLTGVDATGGTTGVAGRGATVGVQGGSDNGIGVHGVSREAPASPPRVRPASPPRRAGRPFRRRPQAAWRSFAVSAVADQGTAVRAWSGSNRAVDARSEKGDGIYVTAGRTGVAAWSDEAIGVMGSATGPNPLNIVRAGVLGQSDTYAGVRGQSDPEPGSTR